MLRSQFTRWGALLLLAAMVPACGGGHGKKKNPSGPPTPGVVSFVAATASKAEGDGITAQTVSIDVHRAGGNGIVTVQFATSAGPSNPASAPADYTAQTGTLTWAAGDFANKTITIDIAATEGNIEGDETFIVTLSNPTNATLGATSVCTVTINDLDGPPDGTFEFSQPVYTIVEDGASTVPVTIRVNRTGGTSGPVTVDCVVAAGTATAATDYTVPGVAGTVTLNFTDGQAFQTFTIDILADGVDGAGVETINLTLNNPTPVPGPEISVSGGTAVVNIVDRQVPGQLQFSSPTYVISETGVTATMTVQRINGAGGALSVDVALSGGVPPAVAGTDYTDPGAITLNWADGDIADKTFTIDVLDNVIVDGNRVLSMLLQNFVGGATAGTNNPATLTITDDEAGTFVFSASDYPIVEGDAGTSTVTITVNRVNGSGGAATVEVLVSDGTATVADLDYVAPGTNPVPLSFAPGETFKTFTITINGDTAFEPDQTILLALQNPTGSSLGAPANATVTIQNDDSPPGGTLTLSATTYSQLENNPPPTNNNITITINRAAPTVGAVSCTFRTANGTARGNGKKRDFISKNVVVNFADGQASATVDVAIVADTTKEPNETFRVTISGATGGAAIGTPSTATVTIQNDD